MLIFLKFIASIALLVCIHLFAMAALGRWWGITVRAVSLGFGPRLLSLGIFHLHAVPLGGNVRFKDTQEEGVPFDKPADYFDDAFDHKPRTVQVLIPLAGVAALIVVALVLRQGAAVPSVVHGFAQFLMGALDPLTTGRQLVSGATAFAGQHAFLPLLGMLAAKLAAVNLLPVPSLNGGQALLTLVTRDLRETPAWRRRLTVAGLLVWVALVASWLSAILAYVEGR
ncbi:site-2 protease family protein [Variovorax sp. NFACC27]|uniref:site-2 protease family protein n=1 Tax=unclassified Variovorax TaxID=663243 RepID=UPI00089759DF|nr:site-2 protease family protein [Variovorax sp. YR750]SEF32544.1 Peptidase family M50 [Variovorax sp. NFACC28]SEG94567.1 Peptidase family M50 [Variovorax sp. NFACC29]SFD70957.1 Peptidase family M50 [Variovorax sp. NFACC26]SFG84863.1 Peptidase family M50 [Variovorax sp. NFACC27]SEK38921.1 Peptidase family M50 [Variovorax sp. YR750]